jgi:hypothetical protein
VVVEQSYRHGRSGKTVRPFSLTAQVQCRAYSLGLQKVVTDFAADCSFAATVEKVREHYGIGVCAGTVRSITEGHAAGMIDETQCPAQLPAGGVRRMISALDGSHVPCVEFNKNEEKKENKENKGDQRHQRSVCWHEAKLCLVRLEGSVSPRYRATMGTADEAGQLLRRVAVEAGAGQATRLHCLGDGARWVVAQVDEQFGAQADYLLDFYHVSEYLAAAGQAITKGGAREWLHIQQARLKENKVAEVLAELAGWREAEAVADCDAPVRRCERYLRDRQQYLNYQRAIAEGLPIGSGEIEGSHRSVVFASQRLAREIEN